MEQLKICYEYWDGGIDPFKRGPRPCIKGISVKEWFNVFVWNMSSSFCDNDFCNKLENGNYYYKYAIYYENRQFIVIYNGMKYYLDLDEDTIDNYEKGECNAITLELKGLLNQFDLAIKREEEKEKQRIELERRNKIIADGKKNIFTDDDAKKIYMDYLTNSHNQKMIDMKDIIKLKALILLFLSIGIPFIFLVKTIIFSLILGVIELVGTISLISSIISTLKEKKKCLNSYTDEFNRLTLEIQSEPKKLPSKIDNTVSKSKSNNKLLFENNILQELSKVVEKLEYVNKEDKKCFFVRVKEIADEYVERLKKINNTDFVEGLQLDADNVFALNSDILGKIALLENEIDKKTDISIREQKIDFEYNLLLRQMEECYKGDMTVIDSTHPTRVRTP